MKIVIVAPSRKMGGIERALSVLANEWVNQGFKVIYVSCLKSEPFYQLDKNIIVIEPEFIREGGFINKIFFYPRLLAFIRKKVKIENPDRVLVFGDWFSPITLLALYGTKFPIYISDRTIPEYLFKFPIPQLKKWLYPKSAGFIAQTERAKDFKQQVFEKKLRIQVIPNALPILNQKSNTNQYQKSNTILYVGRFEWEKDPEILIRAFKEIAYSNPDWILEMAGDGPLFEKMKSLAEELKICKSIIFHGKVQDVAELYSKASIFVLPSVIEGFPNALLEAMSFGLPCICFSDIPYEDIVENDENGIVIKDRNPKNLADVIQILIYQPKTREEIGKQALKSVNLKFNHQHIAGQVLNFMNL